MSPGQCPGSLARTLPRVQLSVRAVELLRIRLPFTRPFRTARSITTHKEALLVRVITEHGDGWGEVGAETTPAYAPDTLDSARVVLRDYLVPQLFAGAGHETVRGHHAAKAGLSTALLDAELRAHGVSLASHLGRGRGHVDAGVAIGRCDRVADLVAEATAWVELGYRSLKLKIAPGHDIDEVAAVRAAVGTDVTIQVDANGSYALADADALAALAAFDVASLEQPLAPDGLLDHARLAERLRTPLCLDESITGARIAQDAIELGACSVVSIKSGMVGGLDEARRTHDLCMHAGVAARAGGMLETGIGRAALLALASLPGFTMIGDCSASSRYFAFDLTEPFVLDDNGRIAVPTGPGIGVIPRPDMLRRCTIAREILEPA